MVTVDYGDGLMITYSFFILLLPSRIIPIRQFEFKFRSDFG